MTHFQEKIAFGILHMASAATCWIGALVNEGEARWIYITLASSMLTAGFLALVFKRAEESIRIVIGRCGLAILGGVLGSRWFLSHYELEHIQQDGIALAGIASALCLGSFIFGFVLINLLARRSEQIASRLFERFIDRWLPPGPGGPGKDDT